MQKKYKKIVINSAGGLRGRKKGSVINVIVDDNGTPVDLYWRRRFKDSKLDNCISFVEEKNLEKIDNKEIGHVDNKEIGKYKVDTKEVK
jgi:hypothetical protein